MDYYKALQVLLQYYLKTTSKGHKEQLADITMLVNALELMDDALILEADTLKPIIRGMLTEPMERPLDEVADILNALAIFNKRHNLGL